MITETMLNMLDGVRDETGASLTSWAVWTRAWTVEENRHGDLLNKYLYCNGSPDRKQSIPRIHRHFVSRKGDLRLPWEHRPDLPKQHGDLKLAQVCRTIVADVKLRETVYTKISEKLSKIDPNATVIAFADMKKKKKKKISMPAHLMFDGRDDDLFEHFLAVAQQLGVYTAKDYADMLEFLLRNFSASYL